MYVRIKYNNSFYASSMTIKDTRVMHTQINCFILTSNTYWAGEGERDATIGCTTSVLFDIDVVEGRSERY